MATVSFMHPHARARKYQLTKVQKYTFIHTYTYIRTCEQHKTFRKLKIQHYIAHTDTRSPIARYTSLVSITRGDKIVTKSTVLVVLCENAEACCAAVSRYERKCGDSSNTVDAGGKPSLCETCAEIQVTMYICI